MQILQEKHAKLAKFVTYTTKEKFLEHKKRVL